MIVQFRHIAVIIKVRNDEGIFINYLDALFLLIF